MKILSLVLPLFLTAAAVAGPVALPLRFDHTPLGNVLRVFSARFHVPVSVSAHAAAPITGDFSSLNLSDALAEAARQAGLTVKPLGAAPADGFLLELPAPHAPPVASLTKTDVNPGEPAPAEIKVALEAAARHRSELLHLQAALAQQATAEAGN